MKKDLDINDVKNKIKFFLKYLKSAGKPLCLNELFYSLIGEKQGSYRDIQKVLPIFREILGNDYIKKFISKFENKPINVNDYDDELNVGGYDFTFTFEFHRMIDDWGIDTMEVFVDIEPGGKVTLMMTDNETYTFEEMEETDPKAWAEVEQEINDLIIDILRHELTYCVGIYYFSVGSIIHY